MCLSFESMANQKLCKVVVQLVAVSKQWNKTLALIKKQAAQVRYCVVVGKVVFQIVPYLYLDFATCSTSSRKHHYTATKTVALINSNLFSKNTFFVQTWEHSSCSWLTAKPRRREQNSPPLLPILTFATKVGKKQTSNCTHKIC